MAQILARRLSIIVAIVCCVLATSSRAVSLRQDKVTDDSVCDLAPFSSVLLANRAKLFVPATANIAALSQIYERLGLQFIAENCRNSQTLILEAWSDQPEEVSAFENVANTVCTASEVVKKKTTIQRGISFRGLEYRCIITKGDQLPTLLAELEAAHPIDSLRQAIAVNKAPADRSASPGSSTKKDCSTLGVGSVLGMGGGACK